MAISESPKGNAPPAKPFRPWYRRPTRIALVIVALWVVQRLWTFWGPATAVRIGPDTTVVEGPFDREGRGWIDYAEALDERRGPLPPEENVLRPLLEAFGPGIIEEAHREAALRHAGVTEETLPTPLVIWTEFEPTWRARQEQRELAGDAPLRDAGSDVPENVASSESAPTIDPLRAFEIAARRPWRIGEFPVLTGYLDANVAPRGVLRQAAGRTQLQVPLLCRSGTYRLSIADDRVYTMSFDVMRQWRLEAMRHLGAGEADKALAAIDDMRRLANWIGQLREESARMVQSAGLKFAFEAEVACLEYHEGRWPASDRSARLTAVEKGIESLAEVVDLDLRFQTLQGIQRSWIEGEDGPIVHLTQDWIGTRNGVDVNAALRRVNTDYDRVVAGLRSVRSPEELSLIDRQITEGWTGDSRDPVGIVTAYLIGSRRRMGSIYAASHIQQTFPVFERLRVMEQESLTELTLLRLAYAVLAHRDRTGVLPNALDEVSRKERVGDATDAFGRAIAYSVEGETFTLSSLGKDGKPDDNTGQPGEQGDEAPRGDDRTIRLDLASRPAK